MPRQRPIPTNPFRFGDIALDDAFANRAQEVAELTDDALNGQNVVVFAPRRYGKTSLVERVAHELTRKRVLVAQLNLMKAATKEQFVEHVMRAVHDDIASPLSRARDSALQLFRGLRVTPRISLDPGDGSVTFSIEGGYSDEDIDATLARLLELPARLGAERNRQVVLIFDEFQEIVSLDPHLPALLRSVFQEQPHVGHIYLGSKRHMMQRIFNDQNEPFWRSAKHMELGPIPAGEFSRFVRRRFRSSGKSVEPETADALLEITGGHPYGTQELAYALWQATPAGETAGLPQLDVALDSVLRSEHSHFARIWEKATRNQRLILQALAAQPGHLLAAGYRTRHRLGTPSTVQYAAGTLVEDELIGKDGSGAYRIVEPFLAEWLRRQS
ncbi:MAG TPA: ATP-binding protein [Gaiellales bacterium]|jgi:hypothetical protein|nr:ATP-binding protein [Gaiellales bacterium]